MDQPKTYALIGRHLAHSFSPHYFQKKFKHLQLSDQYILLDLEQLEDFPRLLMKDPAMNWRGFNVTMPYKAAIRPYLQAISPEAEAIGAVNTIVVQKIGEQFSLTGHNTDYIGFRESLIPCLRPWHTSALILGTGGASKAVGYALHQLGIEFQYVSRHPKENQWSYSALTPELIAQTTLIIQTTPVGMWPNELSCPVLPYEALTPKHLCYDLIYNPAETLFLKQAKAKGAQIKNGLEMLELQAEASYQLWTGR